MDIGVAARSEQDWTEPPARTLDQECEAWDWVRPAGVSAQDLRKALSKEMGYVPIYR
jgi:hypothetical protein